MVRTQNTTSEQSTGVARLKTKYDLVVGGGRVIDPANALDAIRDVGISKGRVAAVAPDLAAGDAKVVDATGLIITPGLIRGSRLYRADSHLLPAIAA